MPFCGYCGHELSAQARSCPECGHPTGVVAEQARDHDATTRMLLPVGRSGWAIAAGYLALFGLVIFPLAPFALGCGLLAVRHIRRTPDLHGMGRAVFGIVVGALWTVAILVGIALAVLRS